MGKRNKIKCFWLDFQNIVNVKCGFCTLMHVLTEENDNDCLQFKENWQFSLKRIFQSKVLKFISTVSTRTDVYIIMINPIYISAYNIRDKYKRYPTKCGPFSVYIGLFFESYFVCLGGRLGSFSIRFHFWLLFLLLPQRALLLFCGLFSSLVIQVIFGSRFQTQECTIWLTIAAYERHK